MLPRWIATLAVVSLLATPAPAQNRETLLEWLLEDPAWTLAGEPVHYAGDDLETLVGDRAEAVDAYGFIGATRLALNGPEGEVEVTLFEMIDSTASYGFFSLERDWNAPGFELSNVGTESYRLGDGLFVWQSKYFGRIRGTGPATAAFGELMAGTIIGSSRKPPVSQHLPPDGLITESEKYLLTPATFEAATGLSAARFGFDDSVEVASAEYRRHGARARLVMLLYPTQQLAKMHSENWIADREPDLPNSRSGPLFAIVAQSGSAALTDHILTTTAYESEVTWNEPLPDPLTLGFMIVTIFTWIGIALLFTLVAGIGFGGFRIYMKTRYPNRFFGEDDGALFLKLNVDEQVTPRRLEQ